MPADGKPILTLMRRDKVLTAEGAAVFYKLVTGRDMSQEQLAHPPVVLSSSRRFVTSASS